MAERFLRVNADLNVVDLLPKIKTPTLVLHSTGDLRVPFSLSQEIAAGISGAKLVPLEPRDHLILAHEPANRAMADAIAEFLGEKRLRGHLPGTTGISERLDSAVGSIQRSRLIKLVVICGTLVSAGIAFWELWRRLH